MLPEGTDACASVTTCFLQASAPGSSCLHACTCMLSPCIGRYGQVLQTLCQAEELLHKSPRNILEVKWFGLLLHNASSKLRSVGSVLSSDFVHQHEAHQSGGALQRNTSVGAMPALQMEGSAQIPPAHCMFVHLSMQSARGAEEASPFRRKRLAIQVPWQSFTTMCDHVLLVLFRNLHSARLET